MTACGKGRSYCALTAPRPDDAARTPISRSGIASRVSLLASLFVGFLHQSLQRAPANLAQVSIIVRQELLVATGAVDVDMSPAYIVVGFAQTTIANEGRFLAHARN